MKYHSKKYIIFLMEEKRFFQNKKQVMSTFLTPLIVVLALLLGLSLVESNVARSKIELYNAEAYKDVLFDNFYGQECFFHTEPFILEDSHLRIDKNNVVIQVLPDEIQVIYDSSLLTNNNVLVNAVNIADAILALQINEATYLAYQQTIDTVKTLDIGQPADYLEHILLPLISLILVVVFMLTNLSISSLTTEAVLGERERGTLDLLFAKRNKEANHTF